MEHLIVHAEDKYILKILAHRFIEPRLTVIIDVGNLVPRTGIRNHRDIRRTNDGNTVLLQVFADGRKIFILTFDGNVLYHIQRDNSVSPPVDKRPSP